MTTRLVTSFCSLLSSGDGEKREILFSLYEIVVGRMKKTERKLRSVVVKVIGHRALLAKATLML